MALKSLFPVGTEVVVVANMASGGPPLNATGEEASAWTLASTSLRRIASAASYMATPAGTLVMRAIMVT